MKGLRTCDICGIAGSPKNPVLAFSLRRSTAVRRDDGSYATRRPGCGGLDLCHDCWERTAKPRQWRKKTA